MRSVCLLVLISTLLWAHVRAATTISKSQLYQTPDECQWSGSSHDDLTLVCKLRTINSELENTNFSVIQPQNTTRLRLECNDSLYFQSSLSPNSFRALVELRQLSIEFCKLSNLTEGSLKGLRSLRNLTIRTHNTDWSSVSMDIAKSVFSEELFFLENLDLSTNNMWTIPDAMLCPLKNLQYFNVSGNKLRDLSHFHLSASISTVLSRKCGPNLKVLDLSHNNIESLSPAIFSNLGKLLELNLSNNGMTFIADRALEGLVSLSVINLAENRLNSLPPELFSEAKNVKEINLSNNTLNVLAPGIFNELQQLLSLDLSRNQLASEWINGLTFKGLDRLVILDLSHNHINKLDSGTFKGLKSLQTLRLQENRIAALPENMFLELSKLTTLTLSNNQLRRIDATTFSGLTSLAILSLDYNQIAEIHDEALANLNSSLQDLHLNGNKLLRVPIALSSVPHLKTLDLGENHISVIENTSFTTMSELYGLRLIENNIEHITRDTFRKLSSLQILNLSRNKIRSVEADAFENNQNLRAIRLDGNYLREITGLFSKLQNLVWLNISDNQLEVFDYAFIPTSLHWLDIHANQIAELGNYFEIESQLSLSTFDASANRLTEITGSSIPNSVEMLYLNDNLIKSVQSYTFFKKPNLTHVDLFGNKITTLDPNALRISAVPEGRELPKFFIGGNPYQCDCNLDWLQKNNVESRTQPKLMDLNSIYCKLLYNRGKTYVPLVEAQPNQFLCKYEQHCFALCHCCEFFACDCKMECPNRCTCYHDQSWSSNVVDCSRADYEERLPDQIPMDASQIYLDGNDFPMLNSHTFIGRKKLRVLFLNNSNVETIQNRTFNGLKELEILQLDSNRLTSLNGFEFIGLDGLEELHLQHNRIATIAEGTFQHLTQLRILRLDNNLLVDISFVTFPVQSISELYLAGNQWSCNCDFVERFREFLTRHEFVKQKNLIKCRNDVIDSNEIVSSGEVGRKGVRNNNSNSGNKYRSGRSGSLSGQVSSEVTTTGSDSRVARNTVDRGFLVLADNSMNKCAGASMEFIENGNLTSTKKTILSPQPIEDYVPLVIATLSGFLFIIVVTLVIFVFRQEMRVWFHSRFGIRLFYRANDCDKAERDKLFDAFISYSSKDEAFVSEELAPLLEHGDPSYKLCLHYRDFPVGAYIADTIVQAVESSRRTIMVLSENFIKSEWCRFEFKSAHHQVLRDRRRRLIVILLGEVPHKDLDPDIRLYLKTNTYLQWGDKLFWEKLRFALPDVPHLHRGPNHQHSHPLNMHHHPPSAQQHHITASHNHMHQHHHLHNASAPPSGGGNISQSGGPPCPATRGNLMMMSQPLPPTPTGNNCAPGGMSGAGVQQHQLTSNMLAESPLLCGNNNFTSPHHKNSSSPVHNHINQQQHPQHLHQQQGQHHPQHSTNMINRSPVARPGIPI